MRIRDTARDLSDGRRRWKGFETVKPYRKEKVARVVRHVVGEALLHQLRDPRIAPLTTVSRVEMTSDLQIAKVYLTVHGGDSAERLTLKALQNASGYLQRTLATELTLRQCPLLRFAIDGATKKEKRIMELLAENRRNDPGPPPEDAPNVPLDANAAEACPATEPPPPDPREAMDP